MREIDVGREHGMYYEGEFAGLKYTELGHMLISLKSVKKVVERYGSKIKNNLNKDMLFLVPKRRERIFNYCTTVKDGQSLLIMLLPESRSGKFCVAEAQVV